MMKRVLCPVDGVGGNRDTSVTAASAPAPAPASARPSMAALVSEPPGPAGFHAPTISDAELAHFREHGYCFLGRCAPLADIEALGARIDELMLGAGADYPRMMMSVCPSETGSWDHPATRQTEGFKYPTLGYRKIQGLEEDAVFRCWVRHPLWRDVTRHVIGEHEGINRAMYFAKPAATEGVRIDWQCVHDAASALQCRAPAPACLILAYPCMPHLCAAVQPRQQRRPGAAGGHRVDRVGQDDARKRLLADISGDSQARKD